MPASAPCTAQLASGEPRTALMLSRDEAMYFGLPLLGSVGVLPSRAAAERAPHVQVAPPVRSGAHPLLRRMPPTHDNAVQVAKSAVLGAETAPGKSGMRPRAEGTLCSRHPEHSRANGCCVQTRESRPRRARPASTWPSRARHRASRPGGGGPRAWHPSRVRVVLCARPVLSGAPL